MTQLYTTLTILCFLYFPMKALGQNCANIGFENGTLDGWQLSYGDVMTDQNTTVFGPETQGTNNKGHLITKITDGNDPLITSEAIPMVAPGSNYSIRIGNKATGAKYDRIKTSFLVTLDNTLFQYRFAIVLEDPDHFSYQQPALRIKIKTLTEGDISCGYYEVTAARGIPGFKEQRPLTYRNWTTSSLDLSRFLGQMITLEITTNDCTKGGHFGYCYFDAECLKMEINQDFPCAEENDAVTLTAPDGFEKYLWNTGERSKTISVLHKTGERYFVNLTPFSSLSENCDLRLDYTIPSGLGTYINKVSICEGETYAVGDSVYRNTGIYLNRLSRPGQCDSLITTELTIIKLPETYQKITICEGDSLHVGNSTYYENGLYFNRIHQPDRCDSLVTTELTVTPLSRYTQELYICEGESIVVGNSTYKKSGTYVNRLSRPNQCDSIVTTHLTVIYLKVAMPTSEQILFGDDLHVKPQIISNDTYTSLWSPNDGLNCYNCDSVLISPTASNTYTLLVQSKLSSCTATAAINIEVVPMCQLFTPDIFTPNQDSVNEIFFPIGGSCIRQILQFTIYNRWGEVIYVARNFPPSEASFGWTGHVKGKPASPGTYNYRIEFEYINTLRQLKSGDFLLVR